MTRRSLRSRRPATLQFASMALVASILVAAPSSAEVERINVEGLGRLPAFSHATVASGQLVFIAGTLGVAPGASEVVAGGVPAQTRQILDNIDRILTAARTNRGNLLQCTVYLTDMAHDFKAYNAVWADHFADPSTAPCRTTLGITALPTPIAIELKCVAVLPKER